MILESRSLCIGERKLESASRLQEFIDCLVHRTVISEVVDHPHSPSQGAVWGGELGRSQLNPKAISAFLGWRQGDIDEWQPDGDRLAECLLALLPQLESVYGGLKYL